jgi:hypothetical protein
MSMLLLTCNLVSLLPPPLAGWVPDSSTKAAVGAADEGEASAGEGERDARGIMRPGDVELGSAAAPAAVRVAWVIDNCDHLAMLLLMRNVAFLLPLLLVGSGLKHQSSSGNSSSSRSSSSRSSSTGRRGGGDARENRRPGDDELGTAVSAACVGRRSICTVTSSHLWLGAG